MKYKIITLLVIISALLSLIFIFLLNKSGNPKSIPLPTFVNIGKKVVKESYSAWVPYWKEEVAIESINGMSENMLSEINPVWYELDQNGKVINSKETDKDIFAKVTLDKKINIVPTITNSTPNGFDSLRVTQMIKNKDEIILSLVDIALKNNYSGWDLDLEEVSSKDKNNYNEFITFLSEGLHKNNLSLSVTVHAQTGNDDWSGTKGQDLEELGKHADYIRVMAYDYHNSESGSGAITPTTYLEDTIKYTLEKVKKEKIVMCLPTYGYDWSKNKVIPLQFEDAKSIVEKENISLKRDEESFELNGEYTKDNIKHTIWYQDAESIFQKIKIIRKYGITNICFWHLGGEDQDIWTKI